MSRAAVLTAGVAAIVLGACASPESSRMRAGGPGADVGNRRAEVLMHEGSRPFAGTPRIAGIEGPSIEPASQAHQLSR